MTGPLQHDTLAALLGVLHRQCILVVPMIVCIDSCLPCQQQMSQVSVAASIWIATGCLSCSTLQLPSAC